MKRRCCSDGSNYLNARSFSHNSVDIDNRVSLTNGKVDSLFSQVMELNHGVPGFLPNRHSFSDKVAKLEQTKTKPVCT